jgi:hypothetical protein
MLPTVRTPTCRKVPSVSTRASKNDLVPLLWTGGWDSTFRLLQLLLLERRGVQPYYLIDADRASTGAEMRAMKDIKMRLFHEHPHTKGLLPRVEYTEVSEIEPDREITEAFRAVAAKSPLGSQYDWIARFCQQRGIQGIELCVHRDDTAHAVLESIVLEQRLEGRTTCVLDMARAPREERALFHRLQFPLFGLSKLEMAAASRAHDWDRYMDLTWFCHHPTARRQPCGTCTPCLHAIKEGLGRRIPLRRRVFSLFHRALFRPLKRAIRVVGQSRRERPRNPRNP